MAGDGGPAAGLSVSGLLRRSAALLAGSTGEMVALFVQGVLVAQALGPALLGVWGIIQATANLTRKALGFRTVEALARFLVEYRDEPQRARLAQVLGSSLLVEGASSLVAAGVVWLAAPWVVHWYHHEPHLPLYRLYAAALLVGGVQPVWAALARARQAFRYLALVPLTFTLAQVAAVVVLFVGGRLTLPAYVLTVVVRQVAQAAYQTLEVVVVARRQLRVPLTALALPRGVRAWREVRPFWQFMTTGFLESTIRAVAGNVDVLVIGAFAGSAAVGCYRVASSLVSVLLAGAAPLITVSYQEFNEALADGQGAALAAYVRRLTIRLGRVALVALPLAWLAAHRLIGLAYGAEFAAAAPLFRILLVGGLTSTVLFWARPLLLALHELRYWVLVVYLTVPASAALMVVAARYLGPAGVAVVQVLTAVTCVVLPARRAWSRLADGRVVAAPEPPPATPGEGG